MAKIAYDESEWPIVVMRFPSEWTTAEYVASFELLEKLLAKSVRFAAVSDTIGSQIPNAHERKLSADFLTKNDAELRRNLVGWAVGADSVIARGAVTAIAWMRPPSFPLASFATLAEAKVWCREQLALER
jgi:hypothetical protein